MQAASAHLAWHIIEHEWLESRPGMPGPCRDPVHIRPVFEAVAIEVEGGKLSDAWVHAVLRIQYLQAGSRGRAYVFMICCAFNVHVRMREGACARGRAGGGGGGGGAGKKYKQN